MCSTRWTVRAASLSSVFNNYAVFQGLWEEALNVAKESDVHARIIGVQATMSKFEYLFDVMLGECLLSHTDNLSKVPD